MTNQEIQVVRHDTLLGCLAAYFDCSIPELKTLKGSWEWIDADGNYHSQPMKAALVTAVLERKAWGWLEDRRILHIWCDKKATPVQVLKVVAHEIGHSRRPHHRKGLRDERKAAQYARVAMMAFDIMSGLIGG